MKKGELYIHKKGKFIVEFIKYQSDNIFKGKVVDTKNLRFESLIDSVIINLSVDDFNEYKTEKDLVEAAIARAKHKFESEQEQNHVQAQKKNGLVHTQYSNGQIAKEYTFVEDMLTGPYKEYWENGSIKCIGAYENNYKIGNWEYFKPKKPEIGKYYMVDGHVVFCCESWFETLDSNTFTGVVIKPVEGSNNRKGTYRTDWVYHPDSLNEVYIKN